MLKWQTNEQNKRERVLIMGTHTNCFVRNLSTIFKSQWVERPRQAHVQRHNHYILIKKQTYKPYLTLK